MKKSLKYWLHLFLVACVCLTLVGCGIPEAIEEAEQAEEHGRDSEKFHENMKEYHQHHSRTSSNPESQREHERKASYHEMRENQERDSSNDVRVRIED